MIDQRAFFKKLWNNDSLFDLLIRFDMNVCDFLKVLFGEFLVLKLYFDYFFYFLFFFVYKFIV